MLFIGFEDGTCDCYRIKTEHNYAKYEDVYYHIIILKYASLILHEYFKTYTFFKVLQIKHSYLKIKWNGHKLINSYLIHNI